MLLRASLFLTIVAGLGSVAQAQQFITIDYPGGAYTNPWGINDSGLIVGYYQFVSNNVNGFLYNSGSFSTIDDPGGTSGTIATGINNGGQIVGTYFDASEVAHGFLDNGGSFSTIDVPGAFATSAYGVNQSGAIVGAYDLQSGSEDQGFLDNGGSFSTIDVPGAVMTDPYAINNSGQILGTYYPASGIAQGFLDNGGSFSTISDPNGPNGTFAMGVNNGGEVVGYYYDTGGIAHGFVEVGGLYSTLDVTGGIGTFPYGINNAGQIVGYYYDSSGYEHGFLYIPSTPGTFTVLHNFSGGGDGAAPYAGLTIDAAGNLYGTTSAGGNGYGEVFKLSPTHGSWPLTPLYRFTGGSDGATPVARIVFGPNGSLYGTTNAGGGSGTCTSPAGCGTVFNLQPTPTRPPTPLTPWIETVLYRFQGGTDGAYPGYGDLVFDSSGAMYNTASQGGTFSCPNHLGCGAVYKLTPSGRNWTQSVIYNFTGGSDGAFPLDGMVFDQAGNLDLTAWEGGIDNGGTVVQLTPSGSGWTETTIHQFTAASDGSGPYAGVILDSSGNLYGAASSSGPDSGGTVFELTPPGGSWTYSVLQNFTGSGAAGPLRNLVMDAAGNLYGTTAIAGAYSYGAVFKLTHSGNSWTYTSLHDFTGGSDGANPYCNLVFDSSGNIYGTASAGGADGHGVVFEITP